MLFSHILLIDKSVSIKRICENNIKILGQACILGVNVLEFLRNKYNVDFSIIDNFHFHSLNHNNEDISKEKKEEIIDWLYNNCGIRILTKSDVNYNRDKMITELQMIRGIDIGKVKRRNDYESDIYSKCKKTDEDM